MSEQDIFLAALDVPNPAERAAYLAEACADNSELLRQVESLLAAHDRSGEFLDVPALKQIDGRLRPAGQSDRAQPVDPDLETRPQWAPSQPEFDLSFLEPATAPDSIGRLGHYEVRQVIGRGACGIVMRAFDEMLCRIVAIKAMAPELAATSPARKRFLREARAAGAIRHDNVVSIHSVEEQPIPFLVMEHIDGRTLQQRLDQSGPLEIAEILAIGEQIARGLEAAHATGLIHRDIKPANILLESRPAETAGEAPGVRVKISDFGLARAADDASLTQSGVIAGTPLYMSAEQARGDAIDARSDLFSLGSVLYVMCSGRPPFRAATTLAVLNRVAEDEPRPIQEIIPEVPRWLSAIIAKLHAKNPADRFGSANEVAGLLGRCGAALRTGGDVDALPEIRTLLKGDATPPSTQGAALGTLGAEASGAGAAGAEAARPDSSGRPDNEQALSLHHPGCPKLHPGWRRRRGWLAAAAILLTAIAGLSLTEASGVTDLRGTVVRLFSPEGTLVVEVDDPAVSVSIDGEEMVITGAGAKEIRLRPGQYNLLATKDGKVVRQELVTVMRDGRQVVRVSREGGVIEPVATDPDRRAAEWVLSIGAQATISVADKARTISRAEELPSEPFFLLDIHGLHRNRKVTDDGLANLRGCSRLNGIALIEGQATDAGMAHLRDLTQFKSLDLRDAERLTDAGLANFTNCRDITNLCLGGSKITDAGLAHFKDCRRLQSLSLLGTQVTEKGLAHFRGCDLRTIGLPGPKITDAALVHFRECTNLSDLWMKGASVTDEGLAFLVNCRHLQSLDLQVTLVTDGVLAHLTQCPKLRSLDLRNTAVTDAGLERLAAMPLPGLSLLQVGGTKVHDAGVRKLAAARPDLRITWSGGVIEPARQKVVETLTSSDWEWAEPLNLGPAINSEHNEQSPSLTADGLCLVFASDRSGRPQVYECRRESVAEPFGEPKMLDDVPYGCMDPFLSADGLTLVMSGYGEQGASDVLMTRRKDRDLGWEAHTVLGEAVNSKSYEQYPSLSADGLTLTFGSDRDRTGSLYDLWQSRRPTIRASFEPAIRLPDAINTKDYESHPRAHSDGGSLLFVRGSALDRSKLFLGVAAPAGGWTTLPLPLPGDREGIGGPFLSADGDVLHFHSVRRFGRGKSDLWMIRRVPKEAAADPDRRAAEWVLSMGGIAKVKVAGIEQQIEEGGKLPAEAFQLSFVHLMRNRQIDDDGMAHLKGCRHIAWLDVRGTLVTDAGLAHLRDCASLETLWISENLVTDAGLAHFNECKRLANLDLHSTQITDAGLADFKDCKYLTTLSLGKTKVTDAGLACFKDCKLLENLNLYETDVTDAGLVYFTDCKNLKQLTLALTSTGDAGLAHFRDCAELTRLDLRETRITDSGLETARRLRKLAYLDVRGAKAVTASEVDAVHKALPECRILWDGGELKPANAPRVE